MSLRRVTAFVGILIATCASFAFATQALALTACQCSCTDTSQVERKLTTVPIQGQTYLQKCQADNICGDRTLSNAYAISITASGGQQERTACECTTPQVTTLLARQAAGDSTCAGTCEAVCRSQEMAVNTAVAPALIQTPCITDADCRTGIFQKFKDVTCAAQTNPTTKAVTHTCSIPVTQENANIECANYGGTDMKGATCDFVAAGNIPSMYLITRPYLSSVNGAMVYQQRAYSGTSYPYSETLWTALDTDGGISSTPGICYLYGSQQADVSNVNVTQALATGINGSKRFVCMKPKISACGTVKINQTSQYPVVKNAIRYSCTPRANVPATQLNTNCLSSSGSYQSDDGKKTVRGADLCSTPGQVCCALHCTLDVECGSYKVCSNGQCVAKTQCSSSHTDWRCRNASAAEQANPSICESGLIRGLCQNSSQFCCAAPNPAAVGSCAADMQNNRDFLNQFGANGWLGFECLTTRDLQEQNQALISDWKQGGSCIMSDVATTRSESKSAARCGTTKRCCLSANVAPTRITQLNNRPPIGTPNCSATLPFNNACINLSSTLGYGSGGLGQSTLPGAQGYDGVYSYGLAVINSGACQATPVSPENPFNTQECGVTNNVEQGVCCYTNLRSCDPDTAGSCSAGETCHPQIKLCVPTQLVDKQLASQSCADRAIAAGDTAVEFVAASNGVAQADFSCQVVASSDSTADTKCAVKGCTLPDGQTLEEGQAYRCCIPGTGQSPSASAATTGIGSPSTSAAQSPSTIGLSSCISSGQCQLDDILYSAANFANFLFRISGAIFLAIFVYAGFKYLTAGASNRGAEGLKMIKQASIGLVLLFSAYLLVNFIQSTFIASSGSKADTCGSTDDTKNMTCQYLPLDASDDKGISAMVGQRKCVRNMCGGPKNRVCCPFGTSQ